MIEESAMSPNEFDSAIAAAGPNKLVVVLFWAKFDPASKPGGQIDALCDELAKKYSEDTVFLKVEAEESEDLAERYELEVVPHIIFMQGGSTPESEPLDVVTGADAPALLEKVTTLIQALPSSNNTNVSSGVETYAEEESDAGLDKRITALISSSRVFLFMKGTQAAPYCKFSKKVVKHLQDAGVTFNSFNIFDSKAIRARIKIYSNWPTFPQLYVEGKLLGGCDIVVEMAEEGELKDLANPPHIEPPIPPVQETIEERIKKLIASSPIMLFMKGTPDKPSCGFSRQMIQILREQGIKNFKTFDILQDSEVRSVIKTLSNWPTFPQLYKNSELIGGLDIVKELIEEGEFAEMMKV